MPGARARASRARERRARDLAGELRLARSRYLLLTCDLAGELRPAGLKHGEEQIALELRAG
eukprot:scaffold58685_cov65-Phaeocystis_antarctica.AAC.4